MSTFSSRIAALFFLLIRLRDAYGSNSSGLGEAKIKCIEVERQALLRVKQELQVTDIDGTDLLSSWGSEERKQDCCKWIGIRCDDKSGHVITLDLSSSTFGLNNYYPSPGNFSSSLIELPHLNYLDFSSINLYPNNIPNFIGKLTNLAYLNFSGTGLVGEIPPHLANLSRLQHLDLGNNSALWVKSLDWVSHLSSLRQLDMSQTDLSQANDGMSRTIQLPYLENLKLRSCHLVSDNNFLPPSLSPPHSSKYLTHVDLSSNDLSISIGKFLTAFSSASLAYLDLSYNRLNGSIPESFENMTILEYLDLSYNRFKGFIPESFGFMTRLEYLDLSYNQFQGSLESFGNMTSPEYLDLSHNQFEGSIPESFGNMTSLEYLDLSFNMLEGEIPKVIWNLCKLYMLRLEENNLSGYLPEPTKSSSRCTYYSLEYLNLFHNQIVGSLPNLTMFSSLRQLWLSSNKLNGTISETIGQLAQLEVLDVYGNSLKGVISEAHFLKHSKLYYLGLSLNSLIFNVSSDWIPPFILDYILLGSCKLGPQFPRWLRTQKLYVDLDISNNGVSDSIPSWFWDLPTPLFHLNLSNNQISGVIANSSRGFGWLEIDLTSNQFEGPIPNFLFRVSALHLSRNKFTRLDSLCDVNAEEDVSTNVLKLVDISYNKLSGELPDCWSNFTTLGILNLKSNELSGNIPVSIGSSSGLATLHLANNNFTGNFPSSLKDCSDLTVLDTGENELSGLIPTWIGENLQKLTILSLRSNRFYGHVPLNLCCLSQLQLLDLSINSISGNVPKCLKNFTAMKESGSIGKTISLSYVISSDFYTFISVVYEDKLDLVWKGALTEFVKNLGLVKGIDLSSNKLKGEIPAEITQLIGLVSLNLSRNNLSGQLPLEIGHLTLLDALDLSSNHFAGKIPSSLSEVPRLSLLDLSNNNLSGKIPTSTQLQSFDPVVYMGNPGLCGAPLLSECPGEGTGSSGTEEGTENNGVEDGVISNGYFIGMGLGFVVGFLGVCGTLLLNKSMRNSYFEFLNDAGDWIFVTVTIYKPKLLRMIKC